MAGPLDGKDVEGAAADPSGHTTVYWDGGHYSYDVDDGQTETDRHTVDHSTDEKVDYPDKLIVEDD